MRAIRSSRMQAVDVWLRGTLGDDLARDMRGMLVTEKVVRGFERIMSQFVSQGAASFSQSGREPQSSSGGRVSDDEYSKMTPAQRWDYAKSFDQKQFTR